MKALIKLLKSLVSIFKSKKKIETKPEVQAQPEVQPETQK